MKNNSDDINNKNDENMCVQTFDTKSMYIL